MDGEVGDITDCNRILGLDWVINILMRLRWFVKEKEKSVFIELFFSKIKSQNSTINVI
jgi:hypothetical protein